MSERTAAEATIAARIRRLAADEVPPQPWFEDRVIEAVAMSVAAPRAREWRFGLAGVAAAVICALIVGVLAGARLSQPVSHATREPSNDAAIVKYRAMVHADVGVIDRSSLRGDCSTRVRCIQSMEASRTATTDLLHDLSVSPPPEAVTGIAARLTASGENYVVQLNEAIAAAAEPNSDYVASSAAPTTAALDLATAQLDCWPLSPVESAHGSSCT